MDELGTLVEVPLTAHDVVVLSGWSANPTKLLTITVLMAVAAEVLNAMVTAPTCLVYAGIVSIMTGLPVKPGTEVTDMGAAANP